MKISDDGGINGITFAEELQESLHKLTTELAKDERRAERDARQTELLEGLRAAEAMHDKARATRTGAWISAVADFAGAATQAVGAIEVRSDNARTSAQGGIFADGGRTLAELGGAISQIATASGMDDEGRSMAAQTLSKGASNRADDAANRLHALEKTDDSVKDLLKSLTDSHHAAIMSILSKA